MQLYTQGQTAQFSEQNFAFLEVEEEAHILIIRLDREEKKNALHPQMVNEIAYAFQYAHHQSHIWLIQIEAKGRVFCAGADLKAFAGMVEPNDSTIPAPNGDILIAELFRKVHVPILAKITGDVYAGGFFFLAGSHFVLASEGIKLGLPEVKRGLYPFQVMQALFSVMPKRKVLDWCLRGYNLPVEEALQYGLATEISTADQIDQRAADLAAEILANSPTALRKGLEAYDHIQPVEETHSYLMDMLRQTIMSKDGQEGLAAFRQKRAPEWTGA
ncbi:MAG: enoyl-CoA hydratase-related protein [Bacteroidota bacterium]